MQIRKAQVQAFKDFQRLLEDISNLRSTIGIKPDELTNLNKTLDGDKDSSSPRKLSAETERELVLTEENLHIVHVNHEDPKLYCVHINSKHSPTGISMQRRFYLRMDLFLSHKLSKKKKSKTYVEKVSDFILKGILRLHQWAGIDPAEIVVPFPKEKKMNIMVHFLVNPGKDLEVNFGKD